MGMWLSKRNVTLYLHHPMNSILHHRAVSSEREVLCREQRKDSRCGDRGHTVCLNKSKSIGNAIL